MTLLHSVTCRARLMPLGQSTQHFVGVVVLWKQMIRCTSMSFQIVEMPRLSLFCRLTIYIIC